MLHNKQFEDAVEGDEVKTTGTQMSDQSPGLFSFMQTAVTSNDEQMKVQVKKELLGKELLVTSACWWFSKRKDLTHLPWWD